MVFSVDRVVVKLLDREVDGGRRGGAAQQNPGGRFPPRTGQHRFRGPILVIWVEVKSDTGGVGKGVGKEEGSTVGGAVGSG